MESSRATRRIDVGKASCDVASGQIEQALIEVSNGISALKLVFTSTSISDTSSVRATAEKELSEALSGPFRWAVSCHWVQDDEPVLVMLSTRQYNSYKPSHQGLLVALSELKEVEPTTESLDRLSYELDNRSLIHILPDQAPKAIGKISSIAHSDNVLRATIAAEILTCQGFTTLPVQAILESQKGAGSSVSVANGAKHEAATFEKRINVDDYNYFELVHPAYFRQTVALATLVSKFVKNPSARAIDVGTGPGTNLDAFHELMPLTEVLAVEPSDVAFQYLRDHFRDNNKITCVHESFLTMPVEYGSIEYIMSSNAAHHFNTDGFLQRSLQWLKPGGYWFIVDEMVAPFDTPEQRSLNLLRHHLSYMVRLCFPWPVAENDIRTAKERQFVDDFNRIVPHAKFFAENGDPKSAESCCRDLLSRTERHEFTTKVSDPHLAFWRLQWLELQALVAGLDYDVEQKTYPQHFIKMAEGAGFVCVAHQRVYGTSGLSDNDAGTHVMAFQKA